MFATCIAMSGFYQLPRNFNRVVKKLPRKYEFLRWPFLIEISGFLNLKSATRFYWALNFKVVGDFFQFFWPSYFRKLFLNPFLNFWSLARVFELKMQYRVYLINKVLEMWKAPGCEKSKARYICSSPRAFSWSNYCKYVQKCAKHSIY